MMKHKMFVVIVTVAFMILPIAGTVAFGDDDGRVGKKFEDLQDQIDDLQNQIDTMAFDPKSLYYVNCVGSSVCRCDPGDVVIDSGGVCPGGTAVNGIDSFPGPEGDPIGSMQCIRISDSAILAPSFMIVTCYDVE